MALHLLVWLGTEPSGTMRWLALALTYATHAALWAAVAAALAHGKTLSWATRDRYWKVALLGPLLTVLLSVAIPSGVAPAAVRGAFVRDVWLDAGRALRAGAAASPRQPMVPVRPGGVAAVSVWRAPANFFCAGVAGLAAMGLLRFIGAGLRLRRRLRDRRPVRDPRLLNALERVRAHVRLRSVRLTETAGIDSPLVIGMGEICIPVALLTGLPDTEVQSVLAHELAHLERGDGLWFPAIALVQAVMWWQPINHWVAARLRHAAELACDDRAVAITGDPLGLARALVQVAAGALATRQPAMVPMMARSTSALLPRVNRLTNFPPESVGQGQGQGREQGLGKERTRLWALAVIATVGLALAGLRIQVAHARPGRPAVDQAVALSARPDAAAQTAQLADLAHREEQLQAELEATADFTDGAETVPAPSPRALRLQQELRHVRAMETWLEDQFLDQWMTWEKSQAAAAHSLR